MAGTDLDRLERQIAEDRKELNALIEEIRSGTEARSLSEDPVIRNRLRNIQDNLYYLQAQLECARQEFSNLPKAVPTSTNAAIKSAEMNTQKLTQDSSGMTLTQPGQASAEIAQAGRAAAGAVQAGQQGAGAAQAAGAVQAGQAAAGVTLAGQQAAAQVESAQNKTQQTFNGNGVPAFADRLSNPNYTVGTPPVNTGNPNPPMNSSSQNLTDRPRVIPEKTATTEEIFGKKIMAVAASALIFISIILFAIVFIPALGTAAKIFMMFAVSAAFLIFGLFKMERERNNSLYESITGCGMGALYISLFVCNIYFKVLNDFLLYILLLLWAGAAIFLSKRYESKVFTVIGQIGILISVIFGTVLCSSSIKNNPDAELKFLVLIIYFLVGSAAYLWFGLREKESRILSQMFNVVNLIILITGLNLISGYGSTMFITAVVLLSADVIAMLVYSFMRWGEEENLTYRFILGIVYSVLLLMLINIFSKMSTIGEAHQATDNLNGILSVIAVLVILAVIEYRLKDLILDTENVPYIVWTAILVFSSAVGIEKITGLGDFIGIGIVAAGCMIYGFITDKALFRIYGYVSFIAYLVLHLDSDYYAADVVFSLLILSAAFFIMYFRKNYKLGAKTVLYVLLNLTVIIKYAEIIMYVHIDEIKFPVYAQIFTLFLIVVIVETLARFTPFRRNWLTGEAEHVFDIIIDVQNLILLLAGGKLLYIIESQVMWTALILIMLAMACFNLKKHFADKNNHVMHTYSGFKFTVFLYLILDSANAPKAAISIGCFIIAIACIGTGFVLKLEKLRIYGLVLSMICVVKLVMFDIVYSNTLGHAISFFVSGLLCFVISAIYNYVGKHMDE